MYSTSAPGVTSVAGMPVSSLTTSVSSIVCMRTRTSTSRRSTMVGAPRSSRGSGSAAMLLSASQ